MRETLSKYFKGDPSIWAVIVILTLFSVLAVYSSTGTLAYKAAGGNTLHYLSKHSALLFFGLFVTILTHYVPFKFYSRIAQLLLFVTPFLLIFTLMSGKVNDAARWLTLPGTGLSFQTSDFAKLALIMYIARYLSKNQDQIKDFKTGFMPIVGVITIICLLILPANFSTAAILFTVSIIILFIGRISMKYISGLAGIGIGALALFILVASLLPPTVGIGKRYITWKNRIERFSNGEDEGNFQVDQAKIAIITGGLVGKGPGNSTQRNFLPHPYSDFIFAIIIEEYGTILGATTIILLYLILLFRAITIVRECKSQFGAFLAVGLTLSLVFQAFINMAVAVNLFPVTGQPLPMVSMGGTSIIFTSIALGIILSVSRSIREKDYDTATA